MIATIATALLEEATKAPEAVDDLCDAVHGGHYGLPACLRLDIKLGGSGTASSPIAMELSRNGREYIDFLKKPELYPPMLRAKADTLFPPFGHFPKWTVPAGFQSDGWFLRVIHRFITPKVFARYHLDLTLIIIEKPSPTPLLYPWQQAIDFNSFLGYRRISPPTSHAPATLPSLPPPPGYWSRRISSRYAKFGKTNAYEVSYNYQTDGGEDALPSWLRDYVKVALLLEPGVECLIEFQSLDLARDKHLFDLFTSTLAPG